MSPAPSRRYYGVILHVIINSSILGVTSMMIFANKIKILNKKYTLNISKYSKKKVRDFNLEFN